MKHHYLTLAFLLFYVSSFSQTLVNLAHTDTLGHAGGQFEFIAATIGADNYLYAVASGYASSDANLLIIAKLDPNFQNASWFVEYDNLSMLGASIYTLNNYVYVVGAVLDSANNRSVFHTIKLDSNTGDTVWTRQYNGSYNGYAAAANIVADDTGNVYVAGTEQTGAFDTRMSVVKYDSLGNQLWTGSYDSLYMFDGAVAMQLDPGKDVAVTGFSGSGFANWDFVTVGFNPNTGVKQAYSRSSNGSGSFSHPVAIRKDELHNMYVLGTSTQNSNSSTDIKLIKYDSLFNQVWVRRFGDTTLNDEAAQLVYSFDQKKLAVLGTVTNTSGGRSIATLLYDSAGTLLWSQTINAPNPASEAAGEDIKIGDDNNLYLAGKWYNGNDTDVVVASYNMSGTLLWLKTYNRGNNTSEHADGIFIGDNNDVIVALTSKGASDTLYEAVEYEQWGKENVVLYDSINDSIATPLYIQNQLIIKFNPEIVKKKFVNDKEQEFTEIENIIRDSVITKIEDITGYNLFGRSKVEKIFKRMTVLDSLSINRLGDTVVLDPFWSAFLIVFPTNTNIQTIKDSLNSQDSVSAIYKYIQYAHENWVGTLDGVPNDYYVTQNEQPNLYPTTGFPNANINIDPAWDIYSECGNEDVKVGVYDHPIYWGHPEFGDGTYAGSKIKGGWDFVTNVHISHINDPGYNNNASHGTEVAGIIGALRNNNLGVAGIVGGDVDNLNKSGCQLFSMGILTLGSVIPLSTISPAIVEGAVYNPSSGYGYGLHVQNHSWGTYAGAPNQNTTQSGINLLFDAVKTCHLNRCAFVVSRGNFVDGNSGSPTDWRYPACFPDDYVICVGGSGTDGEYLDHANASTNDWQAMYDHGVDLVAPAARDLLVSPIWIGHPDLFGEICSLNNGSFHCVAGTSFASPHVSGVAALLMSKHNTVQGQGYPNNLDNDDVQHLIKTYSTSLPQDAAHVGTGRLNAGAAMAMIDRPAYWVSHVSNSSFSSRSSGSGGGLILVSLVSSRWGLPAGAYLAERYTVITTFHNVLSPTSQLIDYWGRDKLNWGCSDATTIFGDPWADYQFTITGNLIDVTTTTHAWCIKFDSYGNGLPNTWIPKDPSLIKTDYSLHIYDAAATGITEPSGNPSFFSVYPNPSNSKVWIGFRAENFDNAILELTDITGQVIRKLDLPNLSGGNHFYSFDLENLATGVYFISLNSRKTKVCKKLLVY